VLRLRLYFSHMSANIEVLKALCYNDEGSVKPRTECRSMLINHLILEESMDVDEAEDLVEKTLNGLGLWSEKSET
jgi:hypothetical protein